MNSSGVTANFGSAASAMLSAIARVHQEALLAAVLGDEGDAVPDAARAASRSPSRRSPTTIVAGVMAVEAEEDAGELGPPGAHQAEDAEHLAAVQGEARRP